MDILDHWVNWGPVLAGGRSDLLLTWPVRPVWLGRGALWLWPVRREAGVTCYPWLSLTRHANIRMDICQVGYDICEFDSLRGLGIDIIGRVHFDNRDRFAIWMGSIGKATEPCQQMSGCWHLTFASFLNLDMGDDTNTKFLLLRVQTTYMT